MGLSPRALALLVRFASSRRAAVAASLLVLLPSAALLA